jgi:hypothetical protein
MWESWCWGERPGANLGANRTNDFPRQTDEHGQAADDHASSRTDPNDAERDTGNYGSALGTAGAVHSPGPTPALGPPFSRPRALGSPDGRLGQCTAVFLDGPLPARDRRVNGVVADH